VEQVGTRQDQAIIESAARCIADYGRHLANSLGGRVETWHDTVMCDPGIAAKYRNMVVLLGPISEADTTQLHDHLINFYGPKGWFVVWSVFPVGLPEARFVRSRVNPLMHRKTVEPLSPPEVPDLEIEEVVDDDGAKLFEQVRETANRLAVTPGNPNGKRMDARTLGGGLRLWVGRINGHAVATAALFENDELSMIKNVSTLAEFRRLGVGTAMSAHAVNSSKQPQILDSDPGAVELYRRLGFSDVGVVEFWSLR
jgi:ribosomal protein S18 acetylase RimI-like enzyme